MYRNRKMAITPFPLVPQGAHAAPEQHIGADDMVGSRTDMWAFGVCLHLLAYRMPRHLEEPATIDLYHNLAAMDDLEVVQLSSWWASMAMTEALLCGGGQGDCSLPPYLTRGSMVCDRSEAMPSSSRSANKDDLEEAILATHSKALL